jgi:ParB family chromosome partitioning protein
MAKIVDYKEIPLGDLVIGKFQVRTRDVGKGIDELAESIKINGLLEPILVAPAEQAGKYEIILGQRRFLAHQLLKASTIMAGILDERVDEIIAKVLSVTENLVRRDLNQKDLIDVCTYLYKKYGSMRAVSDETGLPYDDVRQYVKYDRLIPELKELVDSGEANINVALRAQDATAAVGEVKPKDAVKLAKEMSGMSGAQRKKIQEKMESEPTTSIDEAIEDAKGGGKIRLVRK